MKVAIVTGGSSGIGLGTIKALLKKDCKIYELSRRDYEYENVIHRSVDVTDELAVKQVIDSIYNSEGRIDLLINCAGFGIFGAIEFTELESAKRQLDVNFFGTVNVTKAVLGYMRTAKQGRIINISSVSGMAPLPFQTYYSVSKAAINAYTCALANEVRPFGISVTAIMPGDVHTGFTKSRAKSILGDDVYQQRISKNASKIEKYELNGIDPEIAGKYICKIAFKKRVKPLYAIGLIYKTICVLCMIIPSRLKNWLIPVVY